MAAQQCTCLQYMLGPYTFTLIIQTQALTHDKNRHLLKAVASTVRLKQFEYLNSRQILSAAERYHITFGTSQRTLRTCTGVRRIMCDPIYLARGGLSSLSNEDSSSRYLDIA